MQPDCSTCIGSPPLPPYIFFSVLVSDCLHCAILSALCNTIQFIITISCSQDCCDQILKRLAPVKAAAPDAGWDTWIRTAYMQRINLSAQGFYSPPLEPINWDTGKGNPYSYFVYGVSCSEVEVDCLTGSFTVLRTDIVNDVGDSINPAIDIGQVRFCYYIIYSIMGVRDSYKGRGDTAAK